MFTDITLTDGTTTEVQSEISRVGQKTIRRAASEGLIEPHTMTIAHNEGRDASGKTHRILVRLDRLTNVDAEDPAAIAQESVYVNIVRPHAITDTTDLTWMVDALTDFITTAANQTKLFNGEG